MDNSQLIEQYDDELSQLISRMYKDKIRLDVITWLLKEKAANIDDVVIHADNFLKEYAELPPPME